MAKLIRAMAIVALGASTWTGLSVDAHANAKDNDPSGTWVGTCTKHATGGTWKVEIAISDEGGYLWESSYPDGSYAMGHGTIDRTTRRMHDDEGSSKFVRYSISADRMHIDTDLAECSLRDQPIEDEKG